MKRKGFGKRFLAMACAVVLLVTTVEIPDGFRVFAEAEANVQELKVGDSTTLTYEPLPEIMDGCTIAWSSTDAEGQIIGLAVAEDKLTAEVTAVGVGDAAVSVSAVLTDAEGAELGRCDWAFTVVEPDPVLAGVEIKLQDGLTAEAIPSNVGSFTLTAEPKYVDSTGNPVEWTPEGEVTAAWSVKEAVDFVTLDGSQVLTAVAAVGTIPSDSEVVTFTAEIEGIPADEFAVTIKKLEPSITIELLDSENQVCETLTYGDQSGKLNVTVKNADTEIADPPAVYSIAETDVAEADAEGNLTIHKAGSFTVTASFAGNDDYVAVNDVTKVFTVNPKTLDVILSDAETVITKDSDGSKALSDANKTDITGRVKLADGQLVGADTVNLAVNVDNLVYANTGITDENRISLAAIEVAMEAQNDNYVLNYDSVKNSVIPAKINAVNPADPDINMTETADAAVFADDQSGSLGVSFPAGNLGSDKKSYWYDMNGVPVVLPADGTTKLVDASGVSLIDNGYLTAESGAEVYVNQNEKYYGPYTVTYNRDNTAPVITLSDVEKPQFGQQGKFTYTVQITDTGSGVDETGKIQYIISKNDNVDNLDDTAWLVPDNIVKDGDKYSFEVEVKSTSYLYVKAADNAGNTTEPTLVRTVIVENKEPSATLTVDANSTGITDNGYEQRHTIHVAASDGDKAEKPATYSGIKSIKYELKQGEEVVRKGEFERSETPKGMSDLKNFCEMSADIVFNESSLNGIYTLHVTVGDYCGNVLQAAPVTLYFDNTAPEYEVSMSNGNQDSEKKNYYYKGDNCGIEVKITDERSLDSIKKCAVVITDSKNNQITKDGFVQENNVGIVSVSSDEIKTLADGEIKVTVSLTDESGNENSESTAVSGMNRSEDGTTASFILDQTNPVVTGIETVSEAAAQGIYDGTDYYYNKAFTTTFTITEANPECSLTASVKKDGVDYWNDSVNGNEIAFKLSEDGRYSEFKVSGQDLAGNPLVLANNLPDNFDAVTEDAAAPGTVNMTYSKVIDTEAPVAEIVYTETAKQSADVYDDNGVMTAYYNKNIAAVVTVTDTYGKTAVALDANKLYYGNTAEPTVKVGDDPAETAPFVTCEWTDDGEYYVKVSGTDRAGNSLVVKEYAPDGSKAEAEDITNKEPYHLVRDTAAPVAVIEYTETTNKDKDVYDNDDDGTEDTAYYNKDIEAKISVTDIYGTGTPVELDATKLYFGNNADGVSAVGTDKEDATAAGSYQWTEDGEYFVTVYGTDRAGNALTVKEQYPGDKESSEETTGNLDSYTAKYHLVHDTAAPVAVIEYTEVGSDHLYDNAGVATAYYNTDIEAKISVTDIYGKDTPVELDATKLYFGNSADGVNAVGTDKEDATAADSYQWAADGEYFVTVYGTDRAGNAITVKEQNPDNKEKFETTEGSLNDYTAKYHLVCDKTAPTYTVDISSEESANKTKNKDQGNRYYFNKGFTTALTVDEANFDAERVYVKRTFLKSDDTVDSATKVLDSEFTTRITSTTNVYTETIKSGDGIFRYQVYGTDRAGNALVPQIKNDANLDAVKAVTETDFTSKETQDQEVESDLSVHVVLDTVEPELTVKMNDIDAGGKAGMLFFDGTLKGVNFPQTTYPYRKTSKAEAAITGKDFSPIRLSYDFESSKKGANNTMANYASDAFIRNDSQNPFFDAEQRIRITNLTATDLAGNKSTAQKVYDEAATNWMYLDIEPPVYDELAPNVTMQVSGNKTGKANGAVYGPDGNDLYVSDVEVAVQISDPNPGNIKPSGLYKTYYKAEVNGEDWTDRVSVVSVSADNAAADIKIESGVISYGTAGAGEIVQENEKLTYTNKLKFTFDKETFNYNDVKLTVWAEDNSGNIIAETNRVFRQFGIDITHPRIKVSYDNNAAENEKYFKEDRVATVVVTERNFDESNTPISTQSEAGISGWRHEAGSAPNGDDDTWTCTVTYAVDGDYTFDIDTTDLAGNGMEGGVDYGDSVAPTDFVIDKTKPEIKVTFDNEDVRNEKYYNAQRTATIEITEHNFADKDAEVTTTADIAEGSVTAPGITGWRSVNDINTTTVPFDADGDYTMEVKYVDLAGNEAEPVTVDEFTVDMTEPTLEIGGVEDHSANKGEVAPSITYHDINYAADKTTVSIVGYKNKDGKNLNGTANEDAFGGSFVCTNIEEVPENDDVYLCTGYVEDLAGNSSEAELWFSVNRFGSNYILDDPTEALVSDYYTNEAPTIGVTEINVNTLEFQEITSTLNGEIVELKKGVDYQVTEQGTENTWKEYHYTVPADFFKEDGAYNLTIHSRDEAQNENSNRTARVEEYSKPLDFVLDTKAPEVVISGVENDKQYVEDSRTITLLAEDNIGLKEMRLYMNDELVATYDAEALAEADGTITYQAESQNDWQNLNVVVIDMAGNNGEGEVRYLLTSNLWIQFIHNVPVLVGTIIGLLLLLLLLLFWKRRKKDEEEEAEA